ncbi:MAG: YidB family protein [Betaproteobacteria bacterium]|nr:YidB family protein [Betaproteobacteria bacterium]
MGLLDQLAGQLLGNSNTATGGNELVQLALQLLQNHEGGMSGLLQRLSASGLGEQVQSWIGAGANQSISGEQLTSALGSEAIGALAAKLGLDPASAAHGLAQVLPQIVDHATPNGSAEGADALLQQGLSALGSLFR